MANTAHAMGWCGRAIDTPQGIRSGLLIGSGDKSWKDLQPGPKGDDVTEETINPTA